MRGSPPPDAQRVPFIDWDRPPWNRWSFQHMSQLLRTAPIYKSRDNSNNKLNFVQQDIGHIEFDCENGVRKTIDGFLEDTYTDGLLVLYNDKVVHESYYNGMQPHSVHLGQSVTKSIVSTTAATLSEQGLLDFDAPITEYLPELSATAWNGATVQHVLDMSTGVRFNETYDERDSDVGKTDVACGWKPPPADLDTSDWPTSVWEQILGLKFQEAPHGSRFLYRSIETEVLGFAMERVTEMRLPEIISERLWAPMGAEEDANITVDSLGCSTASGGISASLRDYARFGKLMLDDGMINGKRVLPEWWIDDTRSGDHGKFSAEASDVFATGKYRNQFWIEDENQTTHVCLGVFGQCIYISPAYNMVVVKLSTWPLFLDRLVHRNTIRSFHAIGKALA